MMEQLAWSCGGASEGQLRFQNKNILSLIFFMALPSRFKSPIYIQALKQIDPEV